jgi:Fe-S-cluster containining protein
MALTDIHPIGYGHEGTIGGSAHRMNNLDQRPYFFDAGIRFACQRCGACCTGDPGVVRVELREIADIAGYLGVSLSAVIVTAIHPHGNGHRICETSDGRCLFFDDGCRIYPVRPLQCRTFPFWFANLRAEARWHKISYQCPGIGNGRLYTKNEIIDIISHSFGRRP